MNRHTFCYRRNELLIKQIPPDWILQPNDCVIFHREIAQFFSIGSAWPIFLNVLVMLSY